MRELSDDSEKIDETMKSFESEPSAASLLGLQLNMEDNNFEICRGATKENPGKITQRLLLSFVVSVFDLLAIFASFTKRIWSLQSTLQPKNPKGEQSVF